MMGSMVENLERMKDRFKNRIYNQFLIHGNISDFLPVSTSLGGTTYISLDEYLFTWLRELKMDIVVSYDLAGGMRFINLEQEALL